MRMLVDEKLRERLKIGRVSRDDLRALVIARPTFEGGEVSLIDFCVRVEERWAEGRGGEKTGKRGREERKRRRRRDGGRRRRREGGGKGKGEEAFRLKSCLGDIPTLIEPNSNLQKRMVDAMLVDLTRRLLGRSNVMVGIR
eukprot:1320999-Amorphochlora_amoeboformis.AAC.1